MVRDVLRSLGQPKCSRRHERYAHEPATHERSPRPRPAALHAAAAPGRLQADRVRHGLDADQHRVHRRDRRRGRQEGRGRGDHRGHDARRDQGLQGKPAAPRRAAARACRSRRCSRSTTSGCGSIRAPSELVAACKAAGLKVLLVSGGFTFFANRVKDRLGIDFARSNLLDEADGALTGRVVDAVVGRHLRRRREAPHAARSGVAAGHLARAETIAVGDGANDLPMMGEAGLVGRLPRQAEGARAGDGGDRRRRPRSPARGRQAGLIGVARRRGARFTMRSARRRRHAGPRPSCGSRSALFGW